jgi:hypothetical protein
LTIKCNYIFLTRDNGTGGASPAYANSLKWNPNGWWNQVIDQLNCESGALHPRDAHVRLDVEIFYEANTAAWDLYNARQNLNSSSSSQNLANLYISI